MIIFLSVWCFRRSCELSKKWESCHVPLQLTSVMTRYPKDVVLRPKQRKHLILCLRYPAPKAYGSPTWSTLWVFQTPPGGRWTRNVSLSCLPAMPVKKQYWYWSLYIARKGGGGYFTIKSTWSPPPKKNLLSILMILPNWQLISYSPPLCPVSDDWFPSVPSKSHTTPPKTLWPPPPRRLLTPCPLYFKGCYYISRNKKHSSCFAVCVKTQSSTLKWTIMMGGIESKQLFIPCSEYLPSDRISPVLLDL